MRKRTVVVCLAAALTLSVGNAAAVPYTFTNIAEISLEGPSGLPGASLNNSGTVAFSAILDTGQEGVFTGDGAITTIADTSGPVSSVELRVSPFSTTAARWRSTPSWTRVKASSPDPIRWRIK